MNNINILIIITGTPPSTIGEIITHIYCTVKPEKRKGYIKSDLEFVIAFLRYTVLNKHIKQQNTIVKSTPNVHHMSQWHTAILNVQVKSPPPQSSSH